jgi:hypothetical protein
MAGASFMALVAMLEEVVSSRLVAGKMSLQELRTLMGHRLWRILSSKRIGVSLICSISYSLARWVL